MDFFAELGEKLSKGKQAVSDGARNIADISKCSARISTCEREIALLYQSIGEKYYQLHILDADPELKPLLQQVSDNLDTIMRLNEEIQMIRNLRKCSYCGMEVARDAVFCHHCGRKIKEWDDEFEIQNDVKERICPKCGRTLEDEDVFCIKCGTRVECANEGSRTDVSASEPLYSAYATEENTPEVERLLNSEEGFDQTKGNVSRTDGLELMYIETSAFCQKCGVHLEPGDEFCSNCGSRVEQ